MTNWLRKSNFELTNNDGIKKLLVSLHLIFYHLKFLGKPEGGVTSAVYAEVPKTAVRMATCDCFQKRVNSQKSPC